MVTIERGLGFNMWSQTDEVDEPLRVTYNGKEAHVISERTARKIFRCGNVVIKVDRSCYIQSQSEGDVWTNLDEEDRQYFAWLIEIGPGYVVQEYVPMLKEGRVHDDAYGQMRTLSVKYGLDWDMGSDQYGIDTRTGLLCIHDYPDDGQSYTGHRWETLHPQAA